MGSAVRCSPTRSPVVRCPRFDAGRQLGGFVEDTVPIDRGEANAIDGILIRRATTRIRNQTL